MNDPLPAVLDDLDNWAQLDDAMRTRCAERAAQVAVTTSSALVATCAAIERATTLAPADAEDAQRRAAATDALLTAIARLAPRTSPTPVFVPDDEALASVAALYRRLAGSRHARERLLRCLAAVGSPAALATLAELLAEDPPSTARDVGFALAPMFQRRMRAAATMFPRLFDALAHPIAAPAVLDLANFLAREGLVDAHPATARAAELEALLGGIVERLESLQERPETFAHATAELASMVENGVALAVALCDALALVGDRARTGKLWRASLLAHRRVRAEAAAALARLGEDGGAKLLAELAAEASVRPRVLAYLEELERLDLVPAELTSPDALAAGHLAAWLANAQQFGLGPRALDLIDQRKMFWPGYHEPVDCFLFRYTYRFPQGEYSGIGIAGPVVAAEKGNLEDLPPDDLYALYAGGNALHAEIRAIEPDEMGYDQRAAWQEALEHCTAAGFTRATLRRVCGFFGETHFVATALRQGQTGTLVIDGNRLHWRPDAGVGPPLDWEQAYNLHKGQKLLKAFNAEPAADEDHPADAP